MDFWYKFFNNLNQLDNEFHKDSFLHYLIKSFLPSSLYYAIKFESEKWVMGYANCNWKRSIWDSGGIRKLKGDLESWGRCKPCEQNRWFSMSKNI